MGSPNNEDSIDKALGYYWVELRESHDEQDVTWWPADMPYAVATGKDGIVALFTTELAANHYRMMLVASSINQGWETSHPDYKA